MGVRKSCKIRLYPNNQQKEYFDYCFKDNHVGWNFFVERDKQDYEQYKLAEMYGYLDLFENTNLGKYYTELKNKDFLSSKSDSRIKNHLVKDFERAKFISKGFPQFKSWQRRNIFTYTTSQNVEIIDNKLKIPKCNAIKFRGSIIKNGILKTVTITKNCNNKYYASLSFDKVNIDELPKTSKKVGIDLGIKDMATLSDGFKSGKILFTELDNKISRLNQILHNRKKGSNNRNKARAKLCACYSTKKNKIMDFLHKLSYKIVIEFDEIYIGDVNSKLGLANHKLAKSTSDSHWYEFKRQLEYKSSWYGKLFKVVNEKYTSKTCSKCGYVNSDMGLGIREWVCPDCGIQHDRDVNAAKNILTVGITGIAFSKTNIS